MSAPADALLAKARDRSALFGIVGLGYVGLPLAVELTRAGYRVLGFDVNQAVVDLVNAGLVSMESAIYASSNPEEFERALRVE